MAKRIYTRVKRKLKMQCLRGRNRKKKPKTFKTEEAANKYAEAKGIKKYKLVNLRVNPIKKKIKIVIE